MKAVRKNSVITEAIPNDNAFITFRQGVVLHSNHELIKIGDVILYDEFIPLDGKELVLENNIYAKQDA